ncbi:amino acid adenylation domain-containing protein [Streptomyces albus]|uniref:non-ribosomal peptide synthetase n=1 Tax=Streptomyces albus TaxID=1888 RepID=UPI0033CD7037
MTGPGGERQEAAHRDRAPGRGAGATPLRQQDDALQTLLCAMFAEMLGVREVSPQDSFFERGGSSLLAARLISRVKAKFAVEVGLQDLFQAPTARELAQRIAQAAVLPPERPPLRPRPRSGVLPLSYAQQRMWLLAELEDHSATYHVPFAVRLRGELKEAALEAALGGVLARHEILRTVYPLVDGRPVQRVLPAHEAQPVLQVVRYGPDTLARAMTGAVRRAFDLRAEPPLRSLLFRQSRDDHVLLLVLHHIAGDGWSLRPLLRDLGEAYAARAAGRAPAGEPLPVQYADYTLWQRDFLGTPEEPHSAFSAQLAYWREALAGAPEELSLPTDRPRPSAPDPRGGTVGLTVPAGVHRRLRHLARERDATLFMVVQAAFATLLTRLGAGEDLPIGSAVAGRPDEALDDLVGFFVNTVVLRTDTSGDPSFLELLDRVRERDLAAFDHQDVPFQSVVEHLRPERTAARHPLFQVFLLLQNTGDAELDLPGIDVEVEPIHPGGAKFDLAVHVTERRGADDAPLGLDVTFEYSTALFDRVTVERFAGAFLRVLASAGDDPRKRVSETDILSPEEERLVLTVWNDTAHPLPATTLPEMFEAQAARTPGRTALVDEARSMTYAELDRAAGRVADRLRARGIGAGQLVAVALPRSCELAVALQAVHRTGAAYLPLDPDDPPARTASVLDDARPALVIDEQVYEELTADPRPGTAPPASRGRPTPHDPAYVIYTSGSTGRPKGVVVPHKGIVNRLLWMQSRYPLGHDDRVLQKTPVSFDVSVWELFWPLVTGATLVMAKPRGHRDSAYLAALVRRERITHIHFVPSMLEVFLRSTEAGGCTSLRRVMCSGEALGADLVRRFHRTLDAELHNLYGPTEASVDVTAWPCEHGADRDPVPIGRPVMNTRVYVLDTALRPVLPGVAGELYISGAQLALGYLNRPRLTAERFLPDPFGGPGERMYRTGDLARWASDGVLEYLGRTDDQVKIRGVRIELGEVEKVLARSPAVAHAAVTVRKSPGGLGGGGTLVAHVVPADDRDVSPAALRAHAAAHLPAAMVPAVYVTLPKLPLTPSGKLDRKALSAPPPDLRDVASRPPRAGLEATLARLFAEVLEVPEVGVDDSFFELGGHSLLATDLINRIRTELGAELGFPVLFRAHTVAALARHLAGVTKPAEEAAPGADPHPETSGRLEVLLPLRAHGSRPPLFCVHPAAGIGWIYSGLLAYLSGDVPVYALQSPGLAGPPAPAYGTEELAACYIRHIRTVRPHGPYHLMGWSFGGSIAQEMAAQLQESGEKVALLAVLDGYPAGTAEPAGAGNTSEPAVATPGLLAQLAASLGIRGAPDPAAPGLTLTEFETLAQRDGSPLKGLPRETVQALIQVFARNVRAAGAVSGRVHRGDMQLFVATRKGHDSGAGRPAPESWQPYVEGRITVHEFPCAHGEMMGREALTRIGPVLARCMEG